MTDVRPMDAVRAMRDRGIDYAEKLLEHAEPDAIVRTCEWWDTLTGVGVGLLVNRIKKGGLSEEEASPDGLTTQQRKLKQLRNRFDEIAERFGPGSVTEPHARMQRRPNGADPARWHEPEPEQLCAGDLVVIAVSSEAIEVRCNACAEEAAYTLRGVGALPDAPMATGREEPPRRPAARTMEEVLRRRHKDRGDDLKRVDFAGAARAVQKAERLAALAAQEAERLAA